MKPTVRRAVSMLLISLCLVGLRALTFTPPPENATALGSGYVTNAPVVLDRPAYNPLNNLQFSSPAGFTVHQNRLYVFYHSQFFETPGHPLIALDDTPGPEISLLDRHPTTAVGQWLYGASPASADSKVYDGFWAYNLESGQRNVLAKLPPVDNYGILSDYTADGTIYVPLYGGEEEKFYPVRNGQAGELCSGTPKYPLGERSYCVFHETRDVLRYRQDGRWQDVPEIPPAYDIYLIPTEQGLLVYHYHEQFSLWLLRENGDCQELYTSGTWASHTGFNLHGDYAYVSASLYEPGGAFQLSSEAPDPREGTFRIDLRTGACERLSWNTYFGLFVFDDSGIYACDSRGVVYRLDFDGNILETLVHTRW